MELLFDHTHGKQEHQDLVICRPMAVVDEDEESEATRPGWLALDHPMGNQVKCSINHVAHEST